MADRYAEARHYLFERLNEIEGMQQTWRLTIVIITLQSPTY
jgi:hypothetical protein